LEARPGQVDVEIVAPDASSICSRLAKEALLKAKSVTPHDMTLENYIPILANNIPRLIERAAGEYKEFRDWVERLYVMNHAKLTPAVVARKTARR